MEILDDFSALFALLNEHEVDYLIVGGYALAFHGCPRFTGDVDALVRPTAENASRLMAALDAFGFGEIGLRPTDFTKADTVIQLGVPPVRVDLVTSITGVSIEEDFAAPVAGYYGETPIRYLSCDCLIANKRATGRAKDLADLEALGES